MTKYQKAYEICVEKVKLNIKKMPYGLVEYPAAVDGNYFNTEKDKCKDISHIMTWTTSFFTGMALLAYETSGDKELLQWANSQYDKYYQKVFKTPSDTMHDLGFLFSPYSVGIYKLTGDLCNKSLGIKAADELVKRFVLNGRYIRAWGRMDGQILEKNPERAADHFYTQSQGLAIIDCMMNLPLLYWAWKETGFELYRDIASAHVDITLKYFIRQDASIYHAYRFSSQTGEPIKGENYCGYATESHWARGTTWAIYGFALAYSYTGNENYMKAAHRLSHKFIDCLGEDMIPVWDFKLPKDQPDNKDTSAAAIAICGFMEILKHLNDEKIADAMEKMLGALVNEKYTNYDPDCPGILREQNGNHTYTIFGDYFFMEALAKYLYQLDGCW